MVAGALQKDQLRRARGALPVADNATAVNALT
jgi:hypothetical protein